MNSVQSAAYVLCVTESARMSDSLSGFILGSNPAGTGQLFFYVACRCLPLLAAARYILVFIMTGNL